MRTTLNIEHRVASPRRPPLAAPRRASMSRYATAPAAAAASCVHVPSRVVLHRGAGSASRRSTHDGDGASPCISRASSAAHLLPRLRRPFETRPRAEPRALAGVSGNGLTGNGFWKRLGRRTTATEEARLDPHRDGEASWTAPPPPRTARAIARLAVESVCRRGCGNDAELSRLRTRGRRRGTRTHRCSPMARHGGRGGSRHSASWSPAVVLRRCSEPNSRTVVAQIVSV